MLRGLHSRAGFVGPFKFYKETMLAFSGLLLLSLITVLFASLQNKKYPNVILISVDALRADHLGCYGYARPTSPNIDALAKEGTIFLSAFSHSPKTTPSHISIMTSLHPDTHQVQPWERDKPGKRLSNSARTLAEILRNKGYTTVTFSGGGNVSAPQGFNKGFDLFLETPEPWQIRNAISWLSSHHNKRFFLFLYTNAIHDPYLPPRSYSRKYYPDYTGKIFDSRNKLFLQTNSAGHDWWQSHDVFWENVNKDDPRDIEFLIAQYDAAINYVDNEMISPLLRKLRELDIYKNTLIIITADHGEAFKEHGNFVHKDLYIEVMRVPLIISYPGVIPQHKTVKQLVRLIDIMPTIFDILGIKTNFLMQGKSLSPAIMKDKDLGLSCYSVYNHMKAMRTDKYTLIENTGSNTKDARSYLFNRQIDPGEKNDIIVNNPDIATQLKRQLYEQVQDYRRIGLRYKPIEAGLPDSDSQKLLKSLGYLN